MDTNAEQDLPKVDWSNKELLLAFLQIAFQHDAHRTIHQKWRVIARELFALPLFVGYAMEPANNLCSRFHFLKRRVEGKYRDPAGMFIAQPAADADPCERLIHSKLLEVREDVLTNTSNRFTWHLRQVNWQDEGFWEDLLSLAIEHKIYEPFRRKGDRKRDRWMLVAEDLFRMPRYCNMVPLSADTLYDHYLQRRKQTLSRYWPGNTRQALDEDASAVDEMMYGLTWGSVFNNKTYREPAKEKQQQEEKKKGSTVQSEHV